MKKILFLLVLCLALAGCTGQPQEEPASVPAAEIPQTTEAPTEAPASTRPLTDVFTWMAEGEPYDIPVSLYRGEDFSLYIPDGDWILTTPDSWVFAHNDQITFRIDTYEGIDAMELGTLLTTQGYETDYDDGFTMVTGDNMLRTVTVLEMDGHLCTFCTEYPNYTEYMEGAGYTLSRILDSFLWEIYD